jgi:hypothetical protein
MNDDERRLIWLERKVSRFVRMPPMLGRILSREL